MQKKIIAVMLAAVISAALCGCSEDGKTSLSPVDNSLNESTAAVTAVPKDDSSIPAATILTDSSAAEAKTTTTKNPEKKKPDPVAVDMTPVYASKAWFSKVNTVTSNEKLNGVIEKLDELINKMGSNVGFAYQDMTNGVTITYNTNKQFQTCSTIKVPYCLALLKNGVDLDEKLKITQIYQGAAPDEGHLNYSDLNKEYTVRELIERAVTLSDNTAYITLVNKYGRWTFNSGQYKNSINYLIYDGYYFSMASADEMLKSYKEVYDYSLSDERGKWLVELMTKADFTIQISDVLSSKYKVGHKYGMDQETKSYSDCAICFAERPFVLCIYTEQTPDTDEANQYFQDLARVFDQLNEIIVS